MPAAGKLLCRRRLLFVRLLALMRLHWRPCLAVPAVVLLLLWAMQATATRASPFPPQNQHHKQQWPQQPVVAPDPLASAQHRPPLNSQPPSSPPPPPAPPPSPLSRSSLLPSAASQSEPAAAAATSSSSVEEFLRRVAESSRQVDVASLRAKAPLLNRLAQLPGERSIIDRAVACAGSSSSSRGRHRSLTLQHVQHFDYLHNEPNLCTGQLLLLAAVHTNAKNFNRRATIRRTWGSLRYVGSHRLQLAFFLGAQDDPSVQARIDAESRRHRDLIQLDFREHYRNMSLKHLSIYEWILSHCQSAHFLAKIDDDTFTDVVHLVAFLQHSPPDGFYCSNTRGAKPQRLKRGPKAKWAVSRSEFPGIRYPPYCEGFGYVVRASQLPDLFICSLFHRFFWIDDVYVTGVLPAAAKVPLKEFWKGHSYTGQLPSLASERILDYIFLVADHNEFLEVVWHRLWRSVLQYSLDLTL